MRVVVLGLSVTSSWGNGHATNYRALLRAWQERGDDVLFLERDMPWYAEHRDLPEPPYGRTQLYDSVEALRRWRAEIEAADLLVVGSYLPDGREVVPAVLSWAGGVSAFYDIDTPVTIRALERDRCEYLRRADVPAFDLYLSFTGGPTLRRLEQEFGARRAEAFYCLVDAAAYRPVDVPLRWDLGYLGTYSDDRQPVLERLLLEPARQRPDLRFVVAGPQYPDQLRWPANVERIEHLPPAEHPAFYCAQRLTLNVTRADMVRAGWSPSVRLFEAAACGVPVVSDRWPGLTELFVEGAEILLADTAEQVLALLAGTGPRELRAVGAAARARVLAEHTAQRRVQTLQRLVAEVRAGTRSAPV